VSRLERQAEEADRFAAIEGRLSELVAALHGTVVNHVLDAETVKLDATGVLEKSWTVPFGSVAVNNSTAHTITIVASTRSTDAAPAVGKGVIAVPAGKSVVVPLTGRAVTFYGTAGDVFFFALFTRLMPPNFGS
jgi:hypothetical protein